MIPSDDSLVALTAVKFMPSTLLPRPKRRHLRTSSANPRSIIRKKAASWAAPITVLPLTAKRCRNGQYRIHVEQVGRVYFDRVIADRTYFCAVTGQPIAPSSDYLAPHNLNPAVEAVRISIPGWEYLEARAS